MRPTRRTMLVVALLLRSALVFTLAMALVRCSATSGTDVSPSARDPHGEDAAADLNAQAAQAAQALEVVLFTISCGGSEDSGVLTCSGLITNLTTKPLQNARVTLDFREMVIVPRDPFKAEYPRVHSSTWALSFDPKPGETARLESIDRWVPHNRIEATITDQSGRDIEGVDYGTFVAAGGAAIVDIPPAVEKQHMESLERIPAEHTRVVGAG